MGKGRTNIYVFRWLILFWLAIIAAPAGAATIIFQEAESNINCNTCQ